MRNYHINERIYISLDNKFIDVLYKSKSSLANGTVKNYRIK